MHQRARGKAEAKEGGSRSKQCNTRQGRGQGQQVRETLKFFLRQDPQKSHVQLA